MEERGWIYLAIVLCAYFLPALIATIKGRPNKGAIWALNILGGWTVVGWVVSFIWALTSGRPAAATVVVNAAAPGLHGRTRKCPACAEEVMAEARKCKHCGEGLLPA